MTALDVYNRIIGIDHNILKHGKDPEASGFSGGDVDRMARARTALLRILDHIVIDESDSLRPKLSLNLWPESWENLFDCLHHGDTRIHSQGNFWAAVQSLEEQSNYHLPARRKELGILEQEES